MIRIILALLMLLSLSACVSPVTMGISEAEWKNYSPEERQKIRKGYYEVLRSRFSQEETNIPDGTALHVRVSGGQINVPPAMALSSYTPVEFEIPSGKCQTISLKAPEDKSINIKACYRNKTLYLDPSRYDLTKRVGSIQLHYSPIWDRGFTYQKVSSSGYAHLTNVNVYVRMLDAHESDND